MAWIHVACGDCLVVAVKIAIISDTHGFHGAVTMPEADVLIHCGDWSSHSTERDTLVFASWLSKQDYEHKIVIAGNHDKFAGSQYFGLYSGIHYLQDSSVTIDGQKFWGMPWTPTFFDWYWMKDRGDAMQRVVNRIPLDTNILITHGPQHGVMDRTEEGINAGCEQLADRIELMPNLNLHCFGHIHEAQGVRDLTDVYDMMDHTRGYTPLVSVNASIVNRKMQPINKAVVI